MKFPQSLQNFLAPLLVEKDKDEVIIFGLKEYAIFCKFHSLDAI
jgi:hypothetical protein